MPPAEHPPGPPVPAPRVAPRAKVAPPPPRLSIDSDSDSDDVVTGAADAKLPPPPRPSPPPRTSPPPPPPPAALTAVSNASDDTVQRGADQHSPPPDQLRKRKKKRRFMSRQIKPLTTSDHITDLTTTADESDSPAGGDQANHVKSLLAVGHSKTLQPQPQLRSQSQPGPAGDTPSLGAPSTMGKLPPLKPRRQAALSRAANPASPSSTKGGDTPGRGLLGAPPPLALPRTAHTTTTLTSPPLTPPAPPHRKLNPVYPRPQTPGARHGALLEATRADAPGLSPGPSPLAPSTLSEQQPPTVLEVRTVTGSAPPIETDLSDDDDMAHSFNTKWGLIDDLPPLDAPNSETANVVT